MRGWPSKEQALRERAAQQREAQRVVCGRALRAMRDRGKSLREIALMAGVAERTARKLIREADAAEEAEGAESPPPAAGAPDRRS
jgi:transposase